MRRILGFILFMFFAVYILGVSGTTTEEKIPRNIILIGWDGAQREHVKECLSKGRV